jgi:hypothetical protein
MSCKELRLLALVILSETLDDQYQAAFPLQKHLLAVCAADAAPVFTRLIQELINADLIGLRKTSRNGRIFYEWDLALAPATCPREQQLIQGLCFPDTVGDWSRRHCG